MSDEKALKVRENRLRRAAKRQGLELQKIRRRDPRAVDYGNYWIVDPWNSHGLVFGGQWGASIDEVEEWLAEGRSDA